MKSYKTITKDLEWNPSGLAFIKTLIWNCSNLIIVMYYQNRDHLTMWPNTDVKFVEIEFHFLDVTAFRFNSNNDNLHQLTGFDILDKSNEGLEGINFHVLDYENDTIEFYCDDILFKVKSENIRIS